MLQARRRVYLAQESLVAERLGDAGMEDLEGDRTVVPEIAGQVDDRHAATAELAHELVPSGEGVLQRAEMVGHGVAE